MSNRGYPCSRNVLNILNPFNLRSFIKKAMSFLKAMKEVLCSLVQTSMEEPEPYSILVGTCQSSSVYFLSPLQDGSDDRHELKTHPFIFMLFKFSMSHLSLYLERRFFFIDLP